MSYDSLKMPSLVASRSLSRRNNSNLDYECPQVQEPARETRGMEMRPLEIEEKQHVSFLAAPLT
jgi:hypothetical protein